MLWKVYAWLLIVVAVSNVVGFISHGSGLFPFLGSVICAVAAYAYAYKKSIFPKRNWKIWLLIVIVAQTFRWFVLVAGQDVTSILSLLGLVIFVPAWYCIYILGFSKEEQGKVMKATTIKKKKTKN